MKLDYIKVYTGMGRIACGIAGGIVGFVTGGPLAAVAGLIIGVAAGYVLERVVLRAKKA